MTTSTSVKRTLADDLRPGETVMIEGFIHRRRRLASVMFLIIRDRSGLAQVVITEDRERAEQLGEETVIRATGRAVANPQAPGGVELVDPELEVLGEPDGPPPLELWRPGLKASLPTLLDHAALAWRHPARQRVWRLAAAALQGFRGALEAQDFTEIATPKLVGGATESGANVFGVDYFGRPGYLAQSPQFYKQIMVGVFERVFEVGPVFRAEPHDTVRHLAQYTSLDAELGFIRDHRDVIMVLRSVIAAMIEAVAAVPGAELELPAVPAEFPVIHFAEALALVGADPDEPDLAPEHERRLGEWARREHGSDFLVVEGYPAAKRPFYTHPQPDDHRWTNSFDLIFRGTELVTGGQRLHRLADYRAALAERGEDPESYADYLATFGYGMPPHGGFAIGLERFVAQLTGAANIREVTLFPRDLHRITP
ncbi:aspartate--tRNA(Asn) ligase [Microlunatus sp. GCM10028923]|uniref:aspartate--tRNA(Asn) ligase n=1 Tax=Microlunatus sp. GCM10028923 TaxID=3273400 RepID=UPI00361AE285